MMERVFVYGTLRRGGRAHGRMASAQFICRAWTDWGFAVFDTGMIPVMIRARDGRVRGEVYDVDPATLRALDAYEGAPGAYRREMILLDDGTQVWAYVWHQSVRGMKRVLGGDWIVGRHACEDNAMDAIFPTGRAVVCGICERVLDVDRIGCG